MKRGWLARTTLGAWGKSRRRRQRLQRGGCRRGGGWRPGDIFECDGAFDLLASEDDLLVPAYKNANIAAVITSCCAAAVAVAIGIAAVVAAAVEAVGRHDVGDYWDSEPSERKGKKLTNCRNREAAQSTIADGQHLEAQWCKMEASSLSQVAESLLE